MKIIGYFVIALFAISCLKVGENSYYVRSTGRVEIKQTDIPETGTVNQVVHIQARAEATNGCWSDISFELTKTSELVYSLDAYGIYESFGTCPDVMVYGDTSIAFTPIKTGKYIFHVTKSATETQTDTITVTGEI